MAIMKKNELDLGVTNEALSCMLVGAYLDCFTASSIQISLRFINSIAFQGRSLYVDCGFSCEAALSGDKGSVIDASVDDFFLRRSRFLADIYTCIGMEVRSVVSDIDGSLMLSIGNSFINIQLTPEDDQQGDSVWSVEMEAASGYILSEINYVACVPKDRGVVFLSR